MTSTVRVQEPAVRADVEPDTGLGEPDPGLRPMSTAAKRANLAGVVLPILGLLLAIVLLWDLAADASDLGLLACTYLLSGIGITVGYHRLLTHRAFDAPPAVRNALAILGSTAVQGSVADWVADHRKHHAFPDADGDPHSPHGHGDGVRGVLAGLWHAHVGWLLETQGTADRRRYAPDVLEDRGLRRISAAFPALVLLSLALPGVVGLMLHGGIEGFLRGVLWGGLVRVALLHQVTWSINSLCHFHGRRRFATEDRSTNVTWLALPSLGEAWHHNHHAFPRSAEHGLRWFELDPSAWVIAGLERVGLARRVVRISPERQRERELEAA